MSSWTDRLRQAYDVEPDESTQPVTVDVLPQGWVRALTLARDTLGCTFFDWLSAVDELDDGFRVVCHLAAHRPGAVDHLLVRTLLPRGEPVIASADEVFAGAAWHERETHEMFGIEFTRDGQPLDLEPLLLPDGFEGRPLRKDFVLVSRVVKPWPGAKEPGESDATPVRSRRRPRPPGVPEPGTWGPEASRP